MPSNPPDAHVPAPLPQASVAKPKICAVMVTYNPDSPLQENVQALLAEVDRLVVVDNGSEPSARAAVAAACAVPECEVIWNRENLGLAAALSAGIRRAWERGTYDWIATLDDDSRIPPGFCQAMLEAYESCPYREQVGLIGPHHVVLPKGAVAGMPDRETSASFRERVVVMQSASLLSSEALRRIGLLDDSFFIEYVDIEFCLRLRKHGLKVIEATQVRLAHRLGEPTAHPFLGKTTLVFNHSPIRRYYASRNRLRVYRRYLFSDPLWICHDAWSWFKELIKLVLYEQDRGRKLAFMARGAWDAIRGRTGMYRQARSLSS